MIDKIRVRTLLHVFYVKEARGKEFSDTVNDRTLLFGPQWESTSRRQDLASEVYTYWYYKCNQEERTVFHETTSHISKGLCEKHRQPDGSVTYGWWWDLKEVRWNLNTSANFPRLNA